MVGGRLLRCQHQQHRGQCGEQSVAEQEHPLVQLRPAEVPQHQYASKQQRADHAGAIQGDALFLRSGHAQGDHRDGTGQSADKCREVAHAKCAEPGTQHDEYADKSRDHRRPAAPADVLFEKDHRQDGDEDRHQENQRKRFGHRQRRKGYHRGGAADRTEDRTYQPQAGALGDQHFAPAIAFALDERQRGQTE